MNGGLIGSTGYLYITAMFILIIIGRISQIKKIVLTLGINIILLLLLEYFYGEKLIVLYPNKTSQYQDIVIVFLIVFISIYYLARFVKNSSENEKNVVKEKNIIIENKNKELLDSLTYAALIQKRIMSNESKLQHLFNDSFVLLKPKDIVSGDFYLVKETGKYNIVIVADCTGHGTPAAFLSIMGITLLQKLIKKNSNDLDTSILLNKLRKRLKIYLERNNNSGIRSRDGMDLGICIFNYETYTLQYSGAYRPLIMIRKNGQIEPENFDSKISGKTHTLYSFTPTKNTIGFNYKTFAFENHYIKFYTGDTFYLFSDGYADQFDSENKKKFNLKRFKDELLNTCHLSLKNQGVYLDQLHKNWKGGTEQTDDIIILGIKI
jgi:serine phosphatase RsbU (regulator of sigma subunit)